MGVSWVTFSPDGRRLASTDWANQLKMWNPETGREVATIEDGGESLQCGVYTPDGTQIAAAGSDKTIRLWTAEPHQEVTTLTGHTAAVGRVTFSLNGKRVYSESDNERIVWDLATGLPEKNANWEPPIEQHQVSPDGRWFFANEFHNVLLVDRKYRTAARETVYRTGKARFDEAWHQQQAGGHHHRRKLVRSDVPFWLAGKPKSGSGVVSRWPAIIVSETRSALCVRGTRCAILSPDRRQGISQTPTR